jgi:hypothetical protein
LPPAVECPVGAGDMESDQLRVCPRPATLGVSFERSQNLKQLLIVAFDPLKGRGKVLRTIESNLTDPSDTNYAPALSFDGSTFAITRLGEAEIQIRLLSLSGGSDREITVKGWPSVTDLDWSSDGKGRLRPSSSSSKPCRHLVSPVPGHHGRWQPVLPQGDRGAEAGAETRTPLPLSNLPLFKLCCGTGPPRDQAAGECQPGISIIRGSLANDSGLRDSAHDPERSSEVVAERGRSWADSVHPGNPRIERLSNRYRRAWRSVRFADSVVFCNTSS